MGESKRRSAAGGGPRPIEPLVVVNELDRGKTLRPRLMPAEDMAAMYEASGMTTPDKHDLLIARLGDRVRIAEVGVRHRHAGPRFRVRRFPRFCPQACAHRQVQLHHDARAAHDEGNLRWYVRSYGR